MQRKIGTLRLGLTFAGCFLGAGYVSGQELWQYFGAFGTHGLLGLVLAIALLGGTGVLLLRLNARTGIEAMDALISSEESRMVVTVAQFAPTSVMSPTTCPLPVTAHIPAASPAVSPLAMVNSSL